MVLFPSTVDLLLGLPAKPKGCSTGKRAQTQGFIWCWSIVDGFAALCQILVYREGIPLYIYISHLYIYSHIYILFIYIFYFIYNIYSFSYSFPLCAQLHEGRGRNLFWHVFSTGATSADVGE